MWFVMAVVAAAVGVAFAVVRRVVSVICVICMVCMVDVVARRWWLSLARGTSAAGWFAVHGCGCLHMCHAPIES